MKRFFSAIALLSVAFLASAQNTGRATVTGVVKDDTGAPIPGVTVVATRGQSEPAVAVTGMEGEFSIADLAPGAYGVEAALDGFQSVKTEVKLVTGQKLDVAFKMVPAFGETVEVVAEAVKTGEVAILESRREAAVVSDSISAEEIRKTPDSSAASVVERLTGVTLVGDKYVFVRGLGERYSGTTINGSSLPTTETEKRVVPLDLFPAKLLDSVNVVKTYTPDKPGDFGSGVVEMTTVQFPQSSTLKVSLGTSYVSGVTGGSFRQYSGGLSRWGKGGQRLPADVPEEFVQRKSILNPVGFTPEELEGIGEAFVGPWTGREISTADPGTDVSLTFGTTLGRLGLVLSGVSTHGYDEVDEVQRYFGFDVGDDLIAYNDYNLQSAKETASTGLVGNLSYRLTDANRVFLNTVLTRDASSEDRFQEGLQTNSGGDIRDFRVRYQLEEVRSARLSGEHNLSAPAMGSLVEWSLTSSQATNDSDLRENIYRESDPGVFEMQTGFADSGKLEYFNLEDNIEQGGLTYSTFFATQQDISGSLKVGISRLDRSRDFAARRFRFVTSNHQQFDLTGTPDEVYTAANIRPTGFEIRETTGLNDAYSAAHTIDALFLMSDTTFGKWRVIGGGRYEQSEQSVTTFNPFDTANAVESINKNNDILPSLNLVYQAGSRTNVRFAYGRSLNRPEFRELSPFAFTEVAGGRSVAGNPDLEQATIDGLDLRWEHFPRDGEVVAASVFFKKIDQPIERIVQPTSDFRQSFVNADSADLWGLELELRRSLDVMLPALKHWSVNANFTYVDSKVVVGEHNLSVVTNAERSLEGQSDVVGNLAVQFYKPVWGTMVRVLGSYTGERLADVGARGLPDIFEQPFMSFDVVLSQSLVAFAPGLEIKLAGKNLLGEEREYTQGREIQRIYDPGRKVSLSLSYTPF
ncbi:MAG TPA: TonB-dependent receptor [Thermoanaerobaculia bacterium]|jgi:outer membrane receptor protein involved in Fe transport|nr:TonB-dependent receptor [Thermoanaerobaculia bacterium]